MGMLSKIKSILFDEDIVEIPVRTDELPEKEEKISRNAGFIDHSQEEDDIEIENTFIDEDDPITQVIVPKDDKEEKEEKNIEPEVKREFRFPVDEMDGPKTRSDIKVETRTKEEHVPRRDYRSLIQTERKVIKKEEKDYKKLLNNSEEIKEKKPFKVTPVISPVYGVIDETQKMEEELITIPIKKEEDPYKPRMFGPISFNDTPLPIKKNKTQDDTLKNNLAKLDQNINKLIVEEKKEIVVETKPIESNIEKEIEESYDDYVNTKEYKNITPEIEEVEDETIDTQDEIISSPNYDDLDGIETSGIEEEYLNTDSIEDEVEEPIRKTEDVIKQAEDEDEDAHLDDTIETDLFNLIDSMYKDDEEEIEED